MPVIILGVMLLMSLSMCTLENGAHALIISESRQEYDDRIDFESIRDEVCGILGCPSLGGLHIDEFKMHGTQIAAAQVSLKLSF